jgi:hypothetical protein
MSDKQWMKRYVYTNLHEIFFEKFPIILTKWLEILVEKTRRYRATTSRKWNHEVVRHLNYVSSLTTCAVDFWLDNILGGHVTEFVVDKALSKVHVGGS